MFAESHDPTIRITAAEAKTNRVKWAVALVMASEALAADVDQNPAGVPFSENAKVLVRRVQTTAEDLLREFVAAGWLTGEEAADALFQARHGRPAEERKKRARVPR